MGKAIITGYYRYTDINFEWHQVLQKPSDKSALKAFLAPESMIHPDNPLNLHKKSRQPGVTLTMGTLENGESRLLFSSKQIEYIRYWLYTVGFTEHLLPLPSSHYLLTESSLKTASPVSYKSGAELKAAIKDIQKNNKRLKGTDKTLLALRDAFENMRSCWSRARGTWLAVDFEAWEMDHNVITEFGFSLVAWKDTEEESRCGHFIIQEHKKYFNNTYVPNNREYFLFGESQEIRLPALKHFLQKLISTCISEGPLYLVFHDYHQDVEYLKTLDAPIEKAAYFLPDAVPADGIFVVDTSSLFAALEGLPDERRPLGRLCALLQVPDLDRFHNAGNDAHFTLRALKSMAEGPPLDLQRNSRWPGQTDATSSGGTGVRVNWEPHQIESDYDDMEGIFTPVGPGAGDDENSDHDGVGKS